MRGIVHFCALAVASCSLPGAAQAEEAIVHYPPPMPGLPFSAAVKAGDTIYLSGQIGRDSQGHLPEGMAAQARLALDNLAAEARQAGVGMDAIVKCTVMMQDMTQWDAFNAVYARYFQPGRLPARSAFGVSALAFGALVEVECIAFAPNRSR